MFSFNSVWTICKGSGTDDASAIGTFTREFGNINNGGTAKLVGHKGAEFILQPKKRWAEVLGHWLAHLFGETEYDILQQGQVVGQVSSTRISMFVACVQHRQGLQTSHFLPEPNIICILLLRCCCWVYVQSVCLLLSSAAWLAILLLM